MLIFIGPVGLLFLVLMMFRPIRFIVGWLLILTVAFFVACWEGWIGP